MPGAHMSAVSRQQGTFEVDANGQATYHLPIDLPPGIGNFQPTLTLVYSHRQRNGLLGIGWDVAGLSVITRTKATYAVDGFNGAVAYDAHDRYVLDGQRLINVAGDYGAPHTLYYTELQSWNHVRAGASPEDGFTVVTKSGEQREYGKTADSRILAVGTSFVRVWAMNAATDRNGNRIEFTYTTSPEGDTNSGAYYIDSIQYSRRDDTAPSRFVQFTYETRPDPIVDYMGGYPVYLAYRMRQISVSLSGGEVIRSYTLHYQESTATALSCLASITEAGTQSAGAPTLPPITVVWQDIDSPGFDISPASTLDQHPGQPDIMAMDVTGSGRTDLVQLWVDNSDDALHATTYLATQDQHGQTTFQRAADSRLDAFPTQHVILPVDVNGDGRTDLLVAYQHSIDNELRLAVFLSDGTGAFTSAGTFNTGDPWDDRHLQFFAMDANGDGRTDVVQAYAHYDVNQGDLLYFRSYLSLFGDSPGAMFTSGIVSPTQDPARPTYPLAFWPMDVNGDGMLDIVRVWQRGSDAHIMATAYIGVSTALDQVSFATQVESDLGTFSLPNQVAFLPVDVNGDGVQDMLQIWQEPGVNGTTLHLSTFFSNAAGGFVAGPDTTFANQTITADGLFPMDVDGSGLTALLSKWISGNNELMFSVFRASPSGVYTALPPFSAGTAGTAVVNASFFPGDVNGDGKADLMRVALDVNQQVMVVPYTSSGPYPDLATSITNALGGTVTIDYASLSHSTVYTPADALAFPAGAGCRYPHPMTPTQFPMQAVLGRATYVVAQYTQSNIPALNRFPYHTTSVLRYTDARLTLLGRGWQGFQTLNTLALDSGRSTEQTFNQDFPYTGTVAQTRIAADGTYTTDPRVPQDANNVLLSSICTDYTAVVRAQGATTPFPDIVEVLRNATRIKQYDYGVFDYALAQTYGYDDYGNETLNVYLGYVDPTTSSPLDTAEVVYKYRQYQNDLFPDGWALGFLLYAKDSANASDPDITRFLPGDYHLEARTYTPTTYNLESQGRWDNVHQQYLMTTYGYDAYGNRTSETVPGGFVTTHEYDPEYHTFLMRTTTPDNAQGVPLVTAFGYDPRFGAQVAVRDPNGYVTITGLDAFGRTNVRQGPVPNGNGANDLNAVTPLVTGSPELRQAFQQAIVVSIEHTDYCDDGQGGLYSDTQALQTFPVDTTRDVVWYQSYVDGRGRERETVRESGQQAGNVIVLTDYNGNDQIISQSLPFFSPTTIVVSAPLATRTTYDVLGRPLLQHVPAGNDGSSMTTTAWTYGTGGRVTRVAAMGSDAPYIELFEHHFYDGQDKVRQVTIDPDGANTISTFHYDPVARLLRATDPVTASNPNGVSNTITYDSLDRRLTLDNPDQNTTADPAIKAMSYTYDPNTGWLQQQTDAAQQVTTYTYDSLGRMTCKTLSDGRTFLFTYDDASVNGLGRLTQVVGRLPDTTVQSQYDFGYDAYGNTTATTLCLSGEALPFINSCVFDPQKRLVQQTFPDASVLTRQFAFGQLVTQALDGARIDYPLECYSAWQKAGTLRYGPGILPGDGVVTHYTFNPSGQVTDEVVNAPAGQVLHYTYDYDLLNQLLRLTDTNDPQQNQAFTYTNKRLMQATVPGFDQGTYDYDASGNLILKDGVTYTYQAHFPVCGRVGGQTLYTATPDACGRTMTRTVHGATLSFAYDGLGCLQRVDTADGTTIREMVSDYLGRLVQQTDAHGGKVLYINAAYLVTRPGDGSAATVTKYLLDDRGTAAAITNDGSSSCVLYFRRDYKGSNTHAFGANGTVVTQMAYNGYGQIRLVNGPDVVRPKYEQRAWDAELELYYFGARYYDPMTGRFLTPDTQLGSQNLWRADALNRFAFELNNPINSFDLTGHSSDWIWGLVIGLIAIAVAATIILSGGAATPLAGILVGGVLGAGLNASIYSLTHRDVSGKRFWGGYVANAAVGFAIGAATAGIASVSGSIIESTTANIVSKGWQFAARATLYTVVGAPWTAGADAFNQFMANAIDKGIVRRDVSLDEGVGRAAITGAIFGFLAGAGQAVAEASFLRPSSWSWGNKDTEVFNTEPRELSSFTGAVGENTPLLPPVVRSLTVDNTLKSRFVLFAISESSAIADASLEAAGY